MKAKTVMNEFFNRKFGIKKTSTWYKAWKKEKKCPLYVGQTIDFGVSLRIKPINADDIEDEEEVFFGAWVHMDDLILL